MTEAENFYVDLDKVLKINKRIQNISKTECGEMQALLDLQREILVKLQNKAPNLFLNIAVKI